MRPFGVMGLMAASLIASLSGQGSPVAPTVEAAPRAKKRPRVHKRDDEFHEMAARAKRARKAEKLQRWADAQKKDK